MPRSSNTTSVKVDKYNQNQAKVSPLTWVAIAGFFVSIILILVLLTPNNQEKILEAYEAYGVTTMPENHPLYSLKYDGSLFKKGLEDVIADDEVVILYIGYAACPACQAHITAISTYFTSTGMNEYVDRIYYMDTSNDLNGFNALSAAFEEIVDSTPQLVIFINGEIVDIYNAQGVNPSDATAINRAIRTFYEDGIDLINA
ncbi:MAG: hypothetical protein A2Y45_00220 [Tenericutes bacterium GWC2_34_14]|nr:MAG: hypothetical protein A2Y45_00220 [Tenericutes bacterium GWC2_34_14]OHE34426.1 MAG: hypothetical protein A2012_07840 [Tenericutes bacterium GWE2_34_108]OHE35782.1 MAG: hypothetical protein A2Y46_02545 [Tenericutes bacterium GWF1_35_14]OHE39131.1 MAG: hypothetical protein A2Y44_07385 [Tenericutes bacterium GWF2_35_184]OHE42383.1 MAG: hypothetical protein A3K26_04955 [Tenericutes bacterium RIFOXYA12_FULL_35_10]OHE42802.1 MAG: hypothetical protein A2221_08850 [Tenericutes bacterium RIFOXYA